MNDKSALEHHTHDEPTSEVSGRVSSFGRFWQWLINWPIKVQHTHEYELQSFVPGKIMLHIERPNDPAITEEKLAKDLSDFLDQEGEKPGWKSQLVPPKLEAIITFPPTENSNVVLSIVPVRLTNEQASKNDLVTLLTTIAAELERGSIIIKGQTILKSAEPDWFLGSSGHGPHPPSPGSWPVPAPPPSQAERQFWLIKDDPKQTPQQNTSELPFVNEQGAGVNIAILDTAPLEINRTEAAETWNEDAFIADLLNPGGKLKVHTGMYADVELADYSVVGHRYWMPDHGVFIASIIDSIAPKANLHLFKAFTSYGSANSETIARGILKILQMFRKQNDEANWRPLIVNCSFGLSIHSSTDLTDKIKGMTKSLEEIFKQLTDKEGVIVVAAAGNYINPPETVRQRANYPAAFKDVLAVGALPKASSITPSDYKPASYSNLSNDQNPDEGFMVFGGEPGTELGVRGIYTSEFPVYREGCLSYLWRQLTGTGLDGWRGPGHLPPNPLELTIDRIGYEGNETGYGWWAGTSFAAPHITGIVANWCSQPAASRAPANPARQSINIDNVKWALRERKQRKTTDKNEQVILVIQGPPPS